MEQEERRAGERRGREISKSHGLNDFIHNFWSRYFQDRPDLDRRKQTDRRRPPSVWKRFREWLRSGRSSESG